MLPGLPADQLQAAISGASSKVLQDLDEDSRQKALAIIVDNMGKA